MIPDVEKLERGWMLLGYNFLLVEILQMTSDVLPEPSPKRLKRMRGAASSFIGLINKAKAGGRLIRRSKKGPYRINTSLKKAVEAEKTYQEIGIILSEDINEKNKRRLLNKLKKICKALLEVNCSPAERKFIHKFCHDALKRIDQEHFLLLVS